MPNYKLLTPGPLTKWQERMHYLKSPGWPCFYKASGVSIK